MRKKILIFIPKLYHGGGAERSSLALGDILSTDCDVQFLTLHPGEKFEGKEIHCLNQKEDRISKFIGFFVTPFKLKNFCKRNNIDIVISNMPRANTITMLAKYFAKSKTLNFLITRNSKVQFLLQPIMRIWNGAEKNIAVSKGSELFLNKHGVKNTTTIYNPYNLEKIISLSKEEIPEKHQHFFSSNSKVFLNIGRLHPQKGQAILVRAFAEHLKNGKNDILLIAGEGDERKKLENLIENLRLQKHVFLLGNIKNVYPYLKNADVFVLSSFYEGLPTVLIEALICGTPIIASDCQSGPREILTNIPYGKKISYPFLGKYGVLAENPKNDELRFVKNFFQATSILQETVEQTPDINKYGYSETRDKWKKLLDLENPD